MTFGTEIVSHWQLDRFWIEAMAAQSLMDRGGPEIPEPVAGAANSLLQGGILGALVVLLGAALAYVVWKWNKTNEARVKDQKEMAKSLVDLTTGLNDAIRDLTGTTSALRDAVAANTTASTVMERTISETVRDAVRGYRRYSPSGGMPTPPAPPKGAP